MALFDVLRSRKREEVKPKRLPKGALKQAGKPIRRRAGIDSGIPEKKEVKESTTPKRVKKETQKEKIKQSILAAEFILHPHITEQSNVLAQKGIYTFKVNPGANKIIIKKAIKEMYGFEPIKIGIINIHSKKRISRGRIGIKSGYKKALVYLREGDKIEFV